MFAFASLTLVIFMALLCGAMIQLKIKILNDPTALRLHPLLSKSKELCFIIVQHTSATVSPS